MWRRRRRRRPRRRHRLNTAFRMDKLYEYVCMCEPKFAALRACVVKARERVLSETPWRDISGCVLRCKELAKMATKYANTHTHTTTQLLYNFDVDLLPAGRCVNRFPTKKTHTICIQNGTSLSDIQSYQAKSLVAHMHYHIVVALTLCIFFA